MLFFWKIDAFCSQKRLTCAELYGIVCVAKKVIRNKGSEIMRKKLLTNGNVFKRTDGRWGGVVWYMDEQGERKRKSFSGTTKQEANKKITAYIAEFEKAIEDTDESKKLLRDSLQNWLEIVKFPSVEQTSYDRLEGTARCQIYPLLGDKVVGDITPADVKAMLNHWMYLGRSYSLVKKAYVLLNEYYRNLYVEERIHKNPMDNVEMMKKANFLSAQGKEDLPECETIEVFTDEELEKFKAEAFRTHSTGNRVYQQAGAYILMLNTGLRIGELLGLLNSDIDLENKTMTIRQAVKLVDQRDGTKLIGGKVKKVGKTKTTTSKRVVPLNGTAIEMILDLRKEYYFGEDTPLVCDANGEYANPTNLRKRIYRIEDAAGIETKGLHAFRRTFATKLINGTKCADGSIKTLNIKAVADILGHTTTEITERYYVKKDTSRLTGITDGFEI